MIPARCCLVLLLLAACSTDADESEPGSDSTVVTIPNAPVRADTIAPGQVANSSIVLTEWSISLPKDTLPSGMTQFTIVNRGQLVHGLEVEGAGIEEKVENIQPGSQATLTVNLPPGSYELYCPVRDSAGVHKSKGMNRSVVVR